MVISFIGILIVVFDQLSKEWIRQNLFSGQTLFKLSIFRITNVSNTGAAFGLFPDQSIALTVIAVIGIVALLLLAVFSHRFSPLLGIVPSKIALGLVLGGTAGNLIDRLRFGYVTDFIDFGFWPAFNIADSAVTVGVILFAYSFLSFAESAKR